MSLGFISNRYRAKRDANSSGTLPRDASARKATAKRALVVDNAMVIDISEPYLPLETRA